MLQKKFNTPNAFENFLARIKKFHLVPNDTRYYLISKILNSFKDFKKFQRDIIWCQIFLVLQLHFKFWIPNNI